MNKRIILSFIFTIICFSNFANSIDNTFSDRSDIDLKVINICNLTENDVQEIMQGMLPEMAVEFSAQTILPIRVFLEGDLIHLVENDGKAGTIEVKKTFYARYVDGALFLSANLIDWKPFLAFITGNATIGFNTQDDSPSLVIGAEIHQRT